MENVIDNKAVFGAAFYNATRFRLDTYLTQDLVTPPVPPRKEVRAKVAVRNLWSAASDPWMATAEFELPNGEVVAPDWSGNPQQPGQHTLPFSGQALGYGITNLTFTLEAKVAGIYMAFVTVWCPAQGKVQDFEGKVEVI